MPAVASLVNQSARSRIVRQGPGVGAWALTWVGVWIAAGAIPTLLGSRSLATPASGIALGVCLVSIILVAANAKPRPPLADSSALAARFFSLVKAVWSAILLGLGAWYGAMVGSGMAVASTGDDFMRLWNANAVEPFKMVAFLVSWASSAVLALDVTRLGARGRVRAVRKLDRTVFGLSAAGAPRRWTRRALIAFTHPGFVAFEIFFAFPLLLALIQGSW